MPKAPLPPNRIPMTEAARRLGLDVRTIRRLIAAGKLPAYRIGPKVIRIDPADLDRLETRIPVGGDGTRLLGP